MQSPLAGPQRACLLEQHDVVVAQHAVAHQLPGHVLVHLEGGVQAVREGARWEATAPVPTRGQPNSEAQTHARRSGACCCSRGWVDHGGGATRGARPAAAHGTGLPDALRVHAAPPGARTVWPRGRYLMATMAFVATSRSRRARPKLPLPRSFTCCASASARWKCLVSAASQRARGPRAGRHTAVGCLCAAARLFEPR